MLRLSILAAAAFALTGCASDGGPLLDPAASIPPPGPVEVVKVVEPLPLPGQLKPAPGPRAPLREAPDPAMRIEQANRSARVQPSRSGFINATQVWPFVAGALYQVYASPGKITDIALAPGEEIVSVSAGDTVRWVVGETQSGGAKGPRVHIHVKPTRADLRTNLVINTSRRTYHIELTATENTWMASVSWEYPHDGVTVITGSAGGAGLAPVSDGVPLDRIKFRYRLEGDNPPWRPVRVFDDGEKVYIEFHRGVAQHELPPLFVIGPTGEGQLVNARYRAPYYVVDRMFGAAELKIDDGKTRQVVRIVRTDARRPGIFG